jgi:hypothetical protein
MAQAGGPPNSYDSNGALNVVSHGHTDSSTVRLDVTGLTADTRYVLVDLSDTSGWPHSHTGYVHLDNVSIDVDPDNSAAYTIHLAYLSEIDGTDAQRHDVESWSGKRKAAQVIRDYRSYDPNGPHCLPARTLTPVVTDTGFNTGVSLATPNGNVTPADGDLVLFVEVDAGTIDLSIRVGYHTHA